MSPYIVTLKRTDPGTYMWDPLSRRAVATLDEARCCRKPDGTLGVADLIVESALRRGSTEGYPRDPQAVAREHVTESGGTVGPLPDGTVIEVEPTTDAELEDAIPVSLLLAGGGVRTTGQRCAAFNEAQGAMA